MQIFYMKKSHVLFTQYVLHRFYFTIHYNRERLLLYFIYIYFVFRETYIEREPGEKINDRNDRAIRVAVNWYNTHLNSFDDRDIKVVLLTDDVKNRTSAAENGIPVESSKMRHILVHYCDVTDVIIV